MYQRKRVSRDVPAGVVGAATVTPSVAPAVNTPAGTMEVAGGENAAPQSEGVRVPTSSPSDTTPDAGFLLARLRETEAALKLHQENAAALQRQIEMKQGGRQLSDEQMLDMRKASDKREEFTQGRIERANQFLASNKHLDIDALGKAHEALILQGYQDELAEYHAALEREFGPLKRILPPGAQEDERNPNIAYAAPVSRSEAPNFSSGGRGHQTKITLSREEVEAAHFSGVSQEEFARQKIKMEDYKRRGLIQDTGGR